MIKFENVSYSYSDSSPALKNIKLSINKGETVLLCGESGCGKTSLSRLINGLIPQYYSGGKLQGKISVCGLNPAETPLYELAEHVGSVFQNPRSQFFNVDTDGELAFACENMGMDENEITRRLNDTVKNLELEPLLGRSIFNLSGGEKQRIACGGVTMLSPECIVLDEPSSNLDVPGIHRLRDIMLQWKTQGKTVVIAEHRLWFLRELADRVIYLKDGRISEEFTGTEFFSKPDDFFACRGLRSAHNICPEFKASGRQTEYLILENLDYKYKNGRKALAIPTLNIPMGRITAIVGHNGAGKSTLLNCICGLNKHDVSELYLRGKSYSRRQRMKLSFPVFQDVNHQLFTESVLDEVLLAMQDENEDKAVEILKSTDLDKLSERHPMSLSGGQKQRLAIASAIASGRELLILDEPSSGLDLKHMEALAEEIKKLKALGRTVLIVTHDAELISACCDGIICLDCGQLTNYSEQIFA